MALIAMAEYSDVLLCEYEQLKKEQNDRIRTRDTMFVSMLPVIAAIVGVALQTNRPELLLFMPPTAAILGWTYLTNDYKISKIGAYIRTVLAIQLSSAMDGARVFGWETTNRTDRRRRSRRIIHLVADLLAFCGAPLAALVAYPFIGPLTVATALTAGAGTALAVALAVQFVTYFREG